MSRCQQAYRGNIDFTALRVDNEQNNEHSVGQSSKLLHYGGTPRYWRRQTCFEGFPRFLKRRESSKPNLATLM